MKIKGIVLSIIIGMLISCQTISEEKELATFRFPRIVNSQFSDSIKSTPYQATSIMGVFPTFVGKFRFCDEIDINPMNRDTSIYKDFFYDFSRMRLLDSVARNGFELFIDYNNSVKYDKYHSGSTTILYDHYPVYFVNSTKSDKVFFGKDGYVLGFQEAEGSKYRVWKPIEKFGFDFCGNGQWGLIVHPQEFVLVLMRKYDGNFETKMRVRFIVGENVMVSKSFNGRINESQFYERNSSE